MAALTLQHHAGRPQYVPGIVKRGQHVLAEAHAKHFIAGLGMPGVAQSVQIIMGEKGYSTMPRSSLLALITFTELCSITSDRAAAAGVMNTSAAGCFS